MRELFLGVSVVSPLVSRIMFLARESAVATSFARSISSVARASFPRIVVCGFCSGGLAEVNGQITSIETMVKLKLAPEPPAPLLAVTMQVRMSIS